MAVNLTIGFWAIPLALTIAAFVWALFPRAGDRRSGDYDFTFWLPAAFRLCAAVVLSLVSWLVWSLAR